jgi:hypothetical protein
MQDLAASFGTLDLPMQVLRLTTGSHIACSEASSPGLGRAKVIRRRVRTRGEDGPAMIDSIITLLVVAMWGSKRGS